MNAPFSLSRIRRCVHSIKRYKNWKDIYTLTLTDLQPHEVILRNGTKIRGPENGDLLHLVEEICFRRCYTPDFLQIDLDDIVVDIGANIGIFTLFAAKATSSYVYAFEPLPENCEFIRLNISNNQLKNVKVNRMAVSGNNGTEKLYIAETSGGNLLFDHNIKGRLERYVEVSTITLKDIFDNFELERIDFLKIDCEGSEGVILESTPHNYLERVRKIAMEFHDNVSQLKHQAIQELLEFRGFKTNLVWDGNSPFGYIYAKRK